MVKHTQTICRLSPTNCFSVFDHFAVLLLKGLRKSLGWLHFDVEPMIKELNQAQDQPSYITVPVAYPSYPSPSSNYEHWARRDNNNHGKTA